MSEAEADALFTEADTDGSGALDIDEVAAFLQSKPVESTSTASARAVRAGLMAEYYASVAAKALAEASATSTTAKSTLSHSVDLDYSYNRGCPSEADAKTTVRINAGGAVLSMLPAQLNSASVSTGVVVDVRLPPGSDAEEIVEKAREKAFDGAPFTVEAATDDDDGSPLMRFIAPGVLDKTTSKLPLDELGEGTSIVLTAHVQQTVTELLLGLVLVPLADVRARLVATLSHKAAAVCAALGPAQLVTFLDSACFPVRAALSLGSTFRSFVAAVVTSGPPSDEDVKEAAKTVMTRSSMGRTTDSFRLLNGMAVENDPGTIDQDMKDVFDFGLRPIVGIKGIYLRLGSIGAIINVDTQNFSFEKPTHM